MINRPSHGNLRWRMIALAIFCSIIAVFTSSSSGISLASEKLTEGSSSRQLRNQTVQSIPYHQINQQTKDKISEILKKPSIYRRLPVTAINADPDYFRFLVRYPEVIVNIWQLMGVTQMSTERTGPYTISSNDGAGTISSLELVYGTENLHIFYGTGTYEGPILRRKLTGKCVLVLRSENKIGGNGRPVATSQLDVFLKVENATASLIAKTIQPLVGTTADHNFVESLKFVQRLNETTEKNGPGVQRMGKKLKIDPAVRQHFNEVVDVVFQRAINAAAPGPTARPASFETQYSSPGQPARNLNNRSYPNPNYQAPIRQQPGYKNLRDVGRYQYPTQQQGTAQASYASSITRPPYPNPQTQPGQVANGYGLPARGYHAPNYATPIPRFGYQQGNGSRPVQAGYNSYDPRPGSLSGVQPAGWRPGR